MIYKPDKHKRYIARLCQSEMGILNRTKVILHYSNPHGVPVCNDCGEQDFEFLCLDHIKGGGRREFRETQSKGHSFYRWLINNSFPKGYQILCANCNMKKGKGEQSSKRNPSGNYRWRRNGN